MAATLQGQGDATYGPTQFPAQALQALIDATHFQQRTAMAVTAETIAVSQEATGTPNHATRVALAKASVGDDQSSSNAVITGHVAIGWNYFAGMP